MIHLWDEMDVAPDVERATRMWCAECHRRTLFRFDMDGMPICRECTELEEAAYATDEA